MSLHLALGLASALSTAIPVSGWVHSGADRSTGAGIVATPEGIVYFVDRSRDVVWRLSEAGLDTVVVGMRARSLQLADDGTLVGTSRSERGTEAWRVNSDGAVQMVARGGEGLGLAVDRSGRLYGWTAGPRSEHVRVWRADTDGRFELAGGSQGYRDGKGADVRFFPIGAMTVASDGSLLLTSGPTIRQVLADGRVRTLAANAKVLKPRNSFLQGLVGVVRGHLSGITSDANGIIYVANAGRELVARISQRGEATSFYESPRGWRPVGVSAQRDRVYVLEYGPGVRVQVLDRRGKATSLVELPAV